MRNIRLPSSDGEFVIIGLFGIGLTWVASAALAAVVIGVQFVLNPSAYPTLPSDLLLVLQSAGVGLAVGIPSGAWCVQRGGGE